ncbi:MAG: hypothetical protein ABI836_01965 [Gemmatimonadota bacterium]
MKWPLYLIAIGLIVIPFVDFLTSILPLQPFDIKWRFSAVALFSGFLFTPLLAIALIALMSALAEDRVSLRVLSIFNLVFTVVLIILMVLYLLDVFQIRHEVVGTDERLPFDMSAIRAFVKYIFTIFVLAYTGIAGFRASKDRRPRGRGTTPLVSTQG